MTYPKDLDGNENYIPDAYLKNSDDDEFYARTGDGIPFYRRTYDGYPIFAKDHFDNEIYATIGYPTDEKNGKQIYAKDNAGNEYYFENSYAEYDETSSIGQYYAKKADGTLFYPILPGGQEPNIYAKDFYKNEKYGPEFKITYARDNELNEFYPRDGMREIFVGDRYAVDKENNEIYPRDEHGNETMLGTYTKDKNGREIYPVSHSGFVLLPAAVQKADDLTVVKIVRNMAWTSTRTDDIFQFDSSVDISFIIIVLQNCFIMALIAFCFKK